MVTLKEVPDEHFDASKAAVTSDDEDFTDTGTFPHHPHAHTYMPRPTHIHTYTHTYTYTHTPLHTCTYTYTHLYTHISTHIQH